MQQLGVLRVEPDGQAEDLGEVQPPDLVVLDEARRERRVVPGRVGQVHADVESGLGRHRPVGRHQHRSGDRDGQRNRGHLRRGEWYPATRGAQSGTDRNRPYTVVTFTGTLSSEPVVGQFYFVQEPASICTMTFLVKQGVASQYGDVVGGMADSLQAVKP